MKPVAIGILCVLTALAAFRAGFRVWRLWPARPVSGLPERPLRRPFHVRPRQLRNCAGRLLVPAAGRRGAHGYPIAEQNLMRIMNEVSYLAPHMDEINTVTLDDPELFKYPVAYIIEVGWWTMTDREAAALRAYIQKGGFVIVRRLQESAGGAAAWAAVDGTVFERTCSASCRMCAFTTWSRRTRSFTRFRDRRPRHRAQAYNAGRRSSAASTKTTIRRSG